MAAFPTNPAADTQAFTLARALRWLGHSCPDCCRPATEDILHAPTWLIRRGIGPPTVTLVVIDLTDTTFPPDERRQQLQAINQCTRADRILVCERRNLTSCRAPLDDAPAGSAQPDYRVFGPAHRPS